MYDRVVSLFSFARSLREVPSGHIELANGHGWTSFDVPKVEIVLEEFGCSLFAICRLNSSSCFSKLLIWSASASNTQVVDSMVVASSSKFKAFIPSVFE